MYSTFIIFYTANYCQKIKNFFDVDELISSGLKIEFWDLSAITAHEKLKAVVSEGLIEKKIESVEDLNRNIEQHLNDKCLYLSFVNYAYYSYRVYRSLSKYNVDILYSTSGVIPDVVLNNKSRWHKILHFKELYRALKFRLLRQMLKLDLYKPAKFVLISCNKAICDYKVGPDTVYITCNSGDYNSVIKLRSKVLTPKVVFIDQYMPFHNDFAIRGLDNIDAETYYSTLNRFFYYIEQQYGCRVVICAHPSATKYSEKDFFEGREVIYNDTANQVAQSIGVIAHYSTAISFPVIFSKPIIFITTDEIESKYATLSKYPLLFSKELNSQFANIDCEYKTGFSKIDNKAYNEYLFNYLTTPKTKDISNYHILIAIANNSYQKFQICH